MSGLIVVLPTTVLYDELQSYASMMHQVVTVDHLVFYAVKRFFQGWTGDLEHDPLFNPGSKGADRAMDVSIANDAIQLAAEGLAGYFRAAGIDPRQITEVSTCNKDLMIKLGDVDVEHYRDQGVLGGTIPSVYKVAVERHPRKQSDG